VPEKLKGTSNRILKKTFHGFFQLGKTKMRLYLSSIFNDLYLWKVAARPRAAYRMGGFNPLVRLADEYRRILDLVFSSGAAGRIANPTMKPSI